MQHRDTNCQAGRPVSLVKRSTSPTPSFPSKHPSERAINLSIGQTVNQSIDNSHSIRRTTAKVEELSVGRQVTVKRNTEYSVSTDQRTDTKSVSRSINRSINVSLTAPKKEPSKPQFIDLTKKDVPLHPFPQSTFGHQWQFELDLFIDPVSPFNDTQLTHLIDLLSTVYPFSCVTRIAVPLTTHAEIISQCWNSTRRQLNGLCVLDILDAQAELVDPLKFSASEGMSFSSSSSRRVVSREKWQADRDRAHSGSQSPLIPLSPPTPQSSGRTRVASVALDDHRSVSRAKGNVGETEGGTRTKQFDDSPVKVVDEDRLQIHEISKSLRESRASSAVRKSYPVPQSESRQHGYGLTDHIVKPRAVAHISSSSTRSEKTTTFTAIHQLRFRVNADYAKRIMKFSLFLTDLDAFVPSLTFIFGVARMGRCAIVSSHRLILNNTQESESFLAKECIHEVSNMFVTHMFCNCADADIFPFF